VALLELVSNRLEDADEGEEGGRVEDAACPKSGDGLSAASRAGRIERAEGGACPEKDERSKGRRGRARRERGRPDG